MKIKDVKNLETIDFTNCKPVLRSFGGSDRKFGVIYNDEIYMLKFSEEHAKRTDVSTSYVNKPISEYISCHISQSLGIETQDTLLGTYKDEVVVACKDFRTSPNTSNIEFGEVLRTKYNSSDIGRFVFLEQLYESITESEIHFSPEFQEAFIKRFWDMFVVDALVGNFDRHIGNFGFLQSGDDIRLAPIYDIGSSLLPQIADAGIKKLLGNQKELFRRCLVFPSPPMVVTKEKVGKVGYYDMLASNYDNNCTEALLRIWPKINMAEITNIIENTPFITDLRKEFYIKYVSLRKELILDRAYEHCVSKQYDQESLNRITHGKQFTDDDLKNFIKEYNNSKKPLSLQEKIENISERDKVTSIKNVMPETSNKNKNKFER